MVGPGDGGTVCEVFESNKGSFGSEDPGQLRQLSNDFGLLDANDCAMFD